VGRGGGGAGGAGSPEEGCAFLQGSLLEAPRSTRCCTTVLQASPSRTFSASDPLLPASLPPNHPITPPPLPAANAYFERAGDCFRKAVELEPSNDSYRRALDMSSKAPQLYQELQRQLQAASAAGGMSGPGSPRGAEPRGAPKQARTQHRLGCSLLPPAAPLSLPHACDWRNFCTPRCAACPVQHTLLMLPLAC
jgi:hypothetical protein